MTSLDTLREGIPGVLRRLVPSLVHLMNQGLWTVDMDIKEMDFTRASPGSYTVKFTS